MTIQGKTRKGKKTKATILATAVDIASVEGLEGLSIGRLAKALQMSKSGLFGHFGSKEELQLATITMAREIFMAEVIEPAREITPGLLRLWTLCDLWLTYLESGVFTGGCFYIAASAEFDSRPGPIRDAIAADMKLWLSYLARSAAKAQTLGHISPQTDTAQLAFEINALYMGANWQMQLFDDESAANRTRLAILNWLRGIATPSAPTLPTLQTN